MSNGSQKRKKQRQAVDEFLSYVNGSLNGHYSVAEFDRVVDGLNCVDDRNVLKEMTEKSRDFMVKSYVGFGELSILRRKGSAFDFLKQYQLFQELFLRAYMLDPTKFFQYNAKIPARQQVAVLEEMPSKIGEAVPHSFEKDPKSAKQLFQGLYEVHCKALKVVALQSSIIYGEPSNAERNPQKYLSGIDDGRYSQLALDRSYALIRGAITHKEFFILGDGKFEIRDRQGKRKAYTSKYLDKKLNDLTMRYWAVYGALTIPMAFMYNDLLNCMNFLIKANRDQKMDENISDMEVREIAMDFMRKNMNENSGKRKIQ